MLDYLLYFEIEYYDWKLQVIWLVFTNQMELFYEKSNQLYSNIN